MNYQNLPDLMQAYANYDLVELLSELTVKQRNAIARIIQHHHVEGKPMADLFRGEDKICAETVYYRRGSVDPDTGQQKNVGWIHQPKFKQALDESVRQVMRVRQEAEIHAIQKAIHLASKGTPLMIKKMLQIANDSERASDQIAAAKAVVDFATKHGAIDQLNKDESTSMLEDWWKAAAED